MEAFRSRLGSIQDSILDLSLTVRGPTAGEELVGVGVGSEVGLKDGVERRTSGGGGKRQGGVRGARYRMCKVLVALALLGATPQLFSV